MRIVLFGNASAKNAGIRFRLLAWAARLEAEGHDCRICLLSSVADQERHYDGRGRAGKLVYLLRAWLRRWGQLRQVPGADVVFFRGPAFPYGPPIFERIARLLNPRIVFDIDDAIWEPPAHVDSPFVRFMDRGWVRTMCRLSRHAVVGNAHLADYVRQILPAITIVPTCVDLAAYTEKPVADAVADRPVVLGWTGLADNLGYLAAIAPALQAISHKHRIELFIATTRDYELEGVSVRNERWQMARQYDYFHEADIGLMPLHDSPRARGKCAFKALQYMASGVPVVVSPVGMNATVVQDGENGFLADTPAAWEAALERLIEDAALRQRLGRAARETVRQRYTFDVNYDAFKAALEAAAGGPA